MRHHLGTQHKLQQASMRGPELIAAIPAIIIAIAILWGAIKGKKKETA